MSRYQLRSCVWELTLACCFSCRYCGSGGGKARADELTGEECLDVAEQLAELGCRRVTLIGGEVFLRPGWADVVRALTAWGAAVSIVTNGALVTQELAEELRELGIESVGISLDGPEEVHDRYRQRGSFRLAVEAAGTLRRAGVPVSMLSTLNGENLPRLEELYQTLRELDIFAWQLQLCSPMGNARETGVDVAVDPERVIRFAEGIRETAPFEVVLADDVGYWVQGPDGEPLPDTNFFGCSAGLSTLGIDSAGNVRGCGSMCDERFIEGNVRRRSLRDIWEDPAAFSYNRQFRPELLTGPCRTCAYGSLCAGGCRAYNYFTHSRLYEAPRCAGRRG